MTLAEMFRVTELLLQESSASRAILDGNTLLAALLPLLTEAHGAVAAALPPAESDAVQELSRQAQELDARHDALVGDLYALLSLLGGRSEDGELYVQTRDLLLPDGVAAVTRQTYQAQAGHAGRVREHVPAKLKKAMESAHVGSRSVWELVEEWLTTAAELGRIDLERKDLADRSAPPPGAMQQARVQWQAAVGALRSLVAVARLSDEQAHTLLRELTDAEAIADARVARRRDGSAELPEDAPSTVPIPATNATGTVPPHSAVVATATAATGSAPPGTSSATGS